MIHKTIVKHKVCYKWKRKRNKMIDTHKETKISNTKAIKSWCEAVGGEMVKHHPQHRHDVMFVFCCALLDLYYSNRVATMCNMHIREP